MDTFEPRLCDDQVYRVTRTELRRHLYAVFRFADKTDEVIYITYKGKDDLVLMSARRYARLTGIDIKALIREGKELPDSDEIMASAYKRAFMNASLTIGEIQALCKREREYDELAAKDELSEDERTFRESRTGKQWRMALDMMEQELCKTGKPLREEAFVDDEGTSN